MIVRLYSNSNRSIPETRLLFDSMMEATGIKIIYIGTPDILSMAKKRKDSVCIMASPEINTLSMEVPLTSLTGVSVFFLRRNNQHTESFL